MTIPTTTLLRHASTLLLAAFSATSLATTLTVTDPAGQPLTLVMVRERPAGGPNLDTSDGGYPAPGVPQTVAPEITRFTDTDGRVEFADRDVPMEYLVRKPDYQDLAVQPPLDDRDLRVTLVPETDPFRLAESRPASSWLGALDLGDRDTKLHFQTQCTFCHQQGNAFIRLERTPEEWSTIITRMMRYGSRLSSPDQETMPALLSAGYRKLRENPQLIKAPLPWSPALTGVTVTEWPLGDVMSQVHDMLVAANGLVYVADNIQDRLYEVDPQTNQVTVYKIPHREGEPNGGLLAARLKDFPRHESTSNAHSLAESHVDGHIFITPSAQRRLVEFDPGTKAFTLHEMDEGFYPHTIRVDQQDRVWFTVALSNQVAMFERGTRRFTMYDLPSRGFREWLNTRYIGAIFKLMSWGVPLSSWLPVDRAATGTPLPYGIDITPDGMVWFARLHTDEIGSIDPGSGKITMFKTPFKGPRRLRTDAAGKLWITAFPESAIARFDPATAQFTRFDLPLQPKGADTPYALNVDRPRGIVWVNGNQSDSLYTFDIASEAWQQIPMPRRVTFTRDVEFGPDGTAYTAIAHFPGWHVEDGQSTLIRVERP
jgi:virginiamycin B lyase